MCPSVGPLLSSLVNPARTASLSSYTLSTKDCNSVRELVATAESHPSSCSPVRARSIWTNCWTKIEAKCTSGWSYRSLATVSCSSPVSSSERRKNNQVACRYHRCRHRSTLQPNDLDRSGRQLL